MPQVSLAKSFPTEQALLSHAKQQVCHAIQSSAKLEDEEILYLQNSFTNTVRNFFGEIDELIEEYLRAR